MKMWGSKNSKIGATFSLLGLITLGSVEIPHQTCPRNVPWNRDENLGTHFLGPAPLKFCHRSTHRSLVVISVEVDLAYD